MSLDELQKFCFSKREDYPELVLFYNMLQQKIRTELPAIDSFEDTLKQLIFVMLEEGRNHYQFKQTYWRNDSGHPPDIYDGMYLDTIMPNPYDTVRSLMSSGGLYTGTKKIYMPGANQVEVNRVFGQKP